jgi:hypothetical protein
MITAKSIEFYIETLSDRDATHSYASISLEGRRLLRTPFKDWTPDLFESLASPVPRLNDSTINGDTKLLRKLYILFSTNGDHVVLYGGSTHRIDFRISKHINSLREGDIKYFCQRIRDLSTDDESLILPEYIDFATVENEDYMEALETMMIMALGLFSTQPEGCTNLDSRGFSTAKDGLLPGSEYPEGFESTNRDLPIMSSRINMEKNTKPQDPELEFFKTFLRYYNSAKQGQLEAVTPSLKRKRSLEDE